jgi:hypothetical protein
MTGPTGQQQRFLGDELFQLTLAAVVQRGKVYQPKLSEAARRRMHGPLRSVLDEFSPKYDGPVTDNVHVGNIVRLADRISNTCTDVLYNGRFRIGSAQKALNLWLKYRWCTQIGSMPPHCPFDSFVLAEIKAWRGPTWTALDKPEEYEDLVKAARRQAQGIPLAEWELELYNRVTVPTIPTR